MYKPEANSRWCFLPMCSNTSVNSPNKIFVSVPGDYERKLKWFKVAKREMPKSKSTFYCCEDHFNLEEDMQNYMRFKLMGGKILLKPDVVPHIFDCQEDRKRTASKPMQPLPEKRRRMELVKEALAAVDTGLDESGCEGALCEPTEPSTSFSEPSQVPERREIHGVQTRSVGVQVNRRIKPLRRSASTQYNFKVGTIEIGSSPFQLPLKKSAATSPIKKVKKKVLFKSQRSSSNTSSTGEASSDPYILSSSGTEFEVIPEEKHSD